MHAHRLGGDRTGTPNGTTGRVQGVTDHWRRWEGTWLVGNVARLGPFSLRIEIEGIQTRACSIHVDSHGIVNAYVSNLEDQLSATETSHINQSLNLAISGELILI